MAQAPRDTAEVRIDPPGLAGVLGLPGRSVGVVLFAHGSGSGRHSPRNTHVAAELRRSGIATLQLDLLTPDEELDRRNVFDVQLLARRLLAATDWVWRHPETRGLPVAYFGASTGAGAALITAAEEPAVSAVVSRGGRPDLAMAALQRVRAPTLLIVGGDDEPVIGLNEQALARLNCEAELVVVPGAGHLFEEPGTLDEVIRLARAWFLRWFGETAERSADARPQPDLRR
jgi:putative phosphoribosyl transferase